MFSVLKSNYVQAALEVRGFLYFYLDFPKSVILAPKTSRIKSKFFFKCVPQYMPVFKSWQFDLVPSENWEHLAKTLLVQGFPLKLSWQMATSFYLNTPNTGFSCLICVPSTFICYSPNSSAAVFGDEAGKEVIKIKWGQRRPDRKRIHVLTRGDTRALAHSLSFSLHVLRTDHKRTVHNEKAATCKPGKEISLETESARTLT